MEKMKKMFERCKFWSPVVLRWFIGVAFFVVGLQKLLNLEMTAHYFGTTFGGMSWLAYVVTAVELGGGLLLLANWHAMEAAVALAVVMLVAFAVTFKPMGDGILGVLGGAVTSVTFAYFAGLMSIALNGCKQCEKYMEKR